MPTATPTTDGRALRTGVAYATAAYLWWGLSPIYWKAVAEVPALELLGQRVISSFVVLALLLIVGRRLGELAAVLRDRRAFLTLVVTAALIALNWFVFLWAMAAERVLQVSLGYYVTPLINVLLGVVFLGEHLRRAQGIAVALAAVGVVVLTVEVGTLPWVSLVLAVSFGVYGLLRKTVAAGPEVGLAIETALILPWVLGMFLWRGPLTGGEAVPGFLAADPRVRTLVALSGIVTVTALIWFTHGARRLPLSTLGILQYLAPTGQFLLALLVYGETFRPLHFAAFAFIWLGLGVFTLDLRRRLRAAAA